LVKAVVLIETAAFFIFGIFFGFNCSLTATILNFIIFDA